jgi:hypothetical protein
MLIAPSHCNKSESEATFSILELNEHPDGR